LEDVHESVLNGFNPSDLRPASFGKGSPEKSVFLKNAASLLY